MTMLAIFCLLGAVFFLAERLWPARPQPIVRPGLITDVLYVPIHYLLRVVMSFLATDAMTRAGTRLLPGSVPLLAGRSLGVQVLVVLLVLDLAFYVIHRLKHRWPWWWRLHETHHSSADLDFLSGARFHPLEKILDRAIFLAPLTLLGASEAALLLWSTIDVAFGMLNHANTRWRLGPLRYVFVGPEMHAWHHALDPARRDCNFGNNLSVFDWLFGTARVLAERPERFGVDDAGYPQAGLVGQFLAAFR